MTPRKLGGWITFKNKQPLVIWWKMKFLFPWSLPAFFIFYLCGSFYAQILISVWILNSARDGGESFSGTNIRSIQSLWTVCYFRDFAALYSCRLYIFLKKSQESKLLYILSQIISFVVLFVVYRYILYANYSYCFGWLNSHFFKDF